MDSLSLFKDLSFNCSKAVTRQYSTSFFSAIKLFSPQIQAPIYAVYGMVRFADEIVDTFHEYDKPALLARFKEDTFNAIQQGISLNPILNSFQQTVAKYNIDLALIEAFFNSMEMDLHKQHYADEQEFRQYIYGSAETVGLMCLCIFCEGDKDQFESLKVYAKALGAAFQKINFLRDLQADVHNLERSYFPGFSTTNFNESYKQKIEEDIEADFRMAYKGIKRLPLSARFGVYVAYKYYMALFKKMKKTNANVVLQRRIRIPNHTKLAIVLKASLRNRLNLI